MPRAKAKPARPYTDEDLAEVLDNPEWTDEDFARARPAREVLPPALFEALVEGQKRAAPLKLDPDVAEALQAGGDDWQARANAILRKAVGL